MFSNPNLIGRSSSGHRLAATVTALVLLSGILSVSLGLAPASASPAEQHSTVVFTYNNTVSSLDPIGANFEQDDTTDVAIYDVPVEFNQQNQLVGNLATQFSETDGAKSINITLRSGVHFHNGALLTSSDVAYTLNRDSHIGTGVAQYIKYYKSTTVINSTHLVINLSQPDSLFLPGLCLIYIVNQALVQQHLGTNDGQAWLADHDAGSGPYELAPNTIPQSGTITAYRYSGYWDFSSGRPQTMVFRDIPESTSEASAVRTGEADFVGGLTVRDAKGLMNANGITVLSYLSAVQEYVVL